MQTKFANRTFLLSGESYAGVYIPMLSQKLTEGINNGSFPNQNFQVFSLKFELWTLKLVVSSLKMNHFIQGAAIGNGFMSTKDLYNALVLWSVYHGKVSLKWVFQLYEAKFFF